jgi:oxepin-CoA hydrolase/3-oxo-5,6-dehydrosuberyl-CoA semialdehyde dehydrogenase
VFTPHAAEAGRLTLGLGAHHGRVLVVDERCGKTQTGHGSPMPHLVHGGPGRAGGGEELGGIRSVHHHLQRVAVQGSPHTLSALTGTFLPGASRKEGGPHPFTKHFEGWDTQVINQDGTVVAAYDVLTMVATREGAPGQ